MKSYAALTDDELPAEKRRLAQKKADLSRDLGHINADMEQIGREEHARFLLVAERLLKGKTG